MANLLADILDVFAAAIHRPADHPLDELQGLAGQLRGDVEEAPEPAAPAAVPAPADEPSDPDTPAPVFPAAPEAFGTETAPGD